MPERYYVVTELRSWDITDCGTPLRDTDIVDRLNEQDDDIDRLKARLAALTAAAHLAYDVLVEDMDSEDGVPQAHAQAFAALYDVLDKAPAPETDDDGTDLPL